MNFDEKWKTRFLDLAKMVASWSKDPSTQVGAVIVNDSRIVVAMGYNGFPRGVEDLVGRLQTREIKYPMTVHAELNAILNASGSVKGATCFVTHQPCAPCTAALIQAGIRCIVHPTTEGGIAERFAESFAISNMMIAEANIERCIHD